MVTFLYLIGIKLFKIMYAEMDDYKNIAVRNVHLNTKESSKGEVKDQKRMRQQ